jgi:hypothetical protein
MMRCIDLSADSVMQFFKNLAMSFRPDSTSPFPTGTTKFNLLRKEIENYEEARSMRSSKVM